MYESITYEELKSLPRDQKVDALKELKALYPTQKKIAEKLGVNPANIYNMIAKYVKADAETQQESQVKAARGLTKPAVSDVGKDGVKGAISGTGKAVTKDAISTVGKGATKDTISTVDKGVIKDVNLASTKGVSKNTDKVEVWAPAEPVKTRAKYRRDKKRSFEENMQITINKSLNGEEAQALIVGVSNTFLKNHDYRVEIRISEK